MGETRPEGEAGEESGRDARRGDAGEKSGRGARVTGVCGGVTLRVWEVHRTGGDPRLSLT